MAKFSKNINCKYGFSTYEDVKDTYNWIKKSLQKVNCKDLNTKEHFHFRVGDISCFVDNFSEFIQYGYGVSGFEFVAIHIYASSENEDIYISDGWKGENHLLRVSSDSKETLEKVCEALSSTDLNDTNPSPNITYITTQNNNNTNITGNNNVVINQSEDVDANNPNEKRKESTIKQWLRAIAQNLLSNWIWYLLTLMAGVFISYLISNH